ncbi:MAG: YkgJ family cysteine cluster protein [Myxococcales bacterium]|nr:MAG: YkgJ family cysteine cluster protein [Myxococcales bacterium]
MTTFDCLTCGACCRTGSDGRILVPEQDIARWKASGETHVLKNLVPGHFGLMAFASKADGSCVHLGTTSCENACQIYDKRGTTCQEFQAGSWQCREFRRDFGIDS